jgi:hypothetical protein
MKEKHKEYEKWKKQAIEDINEISLTDHIAFDEFLDGLFDIAFLKGSAAAAKKATKQLKEKFKALDKK